ncbi:RNA polymerase sigma-70 factor (ECF subfamily) [Allocatelliglobosispora scoriae]|uniref:RNA polymerase sigma-70 factor (ECF subfamily) n=1 Tax=Allocatelliglobosispora scoriae TaxID=643052 RepID=A0A841BMU9_9ACTN|nr:sigma-70 family RNA polymerase sigma factor [Allocatelliglobosispora scoriae]MBB5868509.1 RNA polymerase sigma-70 factor (ECF subfamily) [Allocatelliglobosispora scoriae]
MRDQDGLAERFEQDRGRLRAVALRMLGSSAEADDAVQEAWLRLSRTDVAEVGNLSGWLTTVVGRICLDMLRSRSTRREDFLDDRVDDGLAPAATVAGTDPEQETLLADSVGLALMVVLDTLSPAERLAFVLHDMFAVPFDEVAPVIGKSPDAARQLASRARRRVQGQAPDGAVEDQARRREVVEAFLSAAREGRFEALLTVLDPDVVMRSDAAAVRLGSAAEIHGASTLADYWNGKARDARVALLDGIVGAVWAPRGKVRVALSFTVADGRITGIHLTADPQQLTDLDIAIFD